eukprot:TRINITY_DN6134_c0_g1_i2.p1 TRINITY_DN6134_c0_g1~~TRINITY_DN6134_c0_g1_i2.p1  ORF type:complete len:123 (+),score=22.39 TRINITY_DN6134_c0_g1_i2:331-699(+)
MASNEFKNRLEAILKVQMGGNQTGSEVNRTGKTFVAKKSPQMMFFPPPPPPPGAGKPVGSLPPGAVSAVGGFGAATTVDEWTYFIALKIDSLLPLGQLLDNIGGVHSFAYSDLSHFLGPNWD